MTYRTKTYIAADWDGDKAAIDKLHEWNDSKYWSLSFTDAHELTQARDGSLNCSIKASLKTRLDASKTFVLIIGTNTDLLRSGGCQYCGSYNSRTEFCARGYPVDYRSYIHYECDKAVEAYNDGKMNIVVLYNAAKVNRSLCPDAVANIGTHARMQKIVDGERCWDYQSVKEAMSQ
ncbi:MAG: hypothetical protein LBG05_07560 [Treponema sp.]|jgi:hypothetical protein|nr:hypothetical protein [Treponema sp.]